MWDGFDLGPYFKFPNSFELTLAKMDFFDRRSHNQKLDLCRRYFLQARGHIDIVRALHLLPKYSTLTYNGYTVTSTGYVGQRSFPDGVFFITKDMGRDAALIEVWGLNVSQY